MDGKTDGLMDVRMAAWLNRLYCLNVSANECCLCDLWCVTCHMVGKEFLETTKNCLHFNFKWRGRSFLKRWGSSSRGDGGWPGIRYFRFLIANSVDCCIATNVFNGPKTDRPTVRLSLLFLCHLVMGLRIDANPYFAQRTKAKLGAPSSVFRNAPLESYPANPKQCHTYVEHSKIEVLSKSSKKNRKV